MISQLHLVLEFLSLLLYRIFLVFHSCILFIMYLTLILIYFYLNLRKYYVYVFNVKHQEQLATSLVWCYTNAEFIIIIIIIITIQLSRTNQ